MLHRAVSNHAVPHGTVPCPSLRFPYRRIIVSDRSQSNRGRKYTVSHMKPAYRVNKHNVSQTLHVKTCRVEPCRVSNRASAYRAVPCRVAKEIESHRAECIWCQTVSKCVAFKTCRFQTVSNRVAFRAVSCRALS